MKYDDATKVLEHCDPVFAQSWEQIDVARPLSAGFIDAMAIIAHENNSRLRIALEGPGFAELFGADRAQETPNFLISADRQDREELISACQAARIAQGNVQVDISWNAGTGLHADDGDNFFNTIVSIMHVGTIGSTDLLYFAFRDISNRRVAEHLQTRSQFSSALRALFDEIFMLNLDTGMSEPIFARGKPLIDEGGKPIESGFHALFKTVHSDDIKMFWKYSNYLYVERKLFGPEAEDAIVFDLRRSDDDGDFHWVRVFISRLTGMKKHKTVLVCCQNIDEQKDAQRRERELRSKAQTDALTGIYNHGTSEELIRATLQALGPNDSALFTIIDVDDFKRVNDTYGHSTGDKLLQAVAAATRGICRENDIVGRMGGDEFIALLSGEHVPNDHSLRKRLEHCKHEVCVASSEMGIDPPVTLSIGVVKATYGDALYSDIFDRADRLLYEVKRTGKDALRFE